MTDKGCPECQYLLNHVEEHKWPETCGMCGYHIGYLYDPFKRMMDYIVAHCSEPWSRQTVIAIVCLPGEEQAVHDKIMHYLDTYPRPMGSNKPDRYKATHRDPCLRYDNGAVVSIMVYEEDWIGRTFNIIGMTCGFYELESDTRLCLASSVYTNTYLHRDIEVYRMKYPPIIIE